MSPQIMTSEPPLYVDLDGTLVHGDTSAETLARYLLSRPAGLFEVLAWLTRGRARVKHELVARVDADVSHLPYNELFMARLRELRASAGAPELILASGAHHRIVQAVADQCGFDAVLASDAEVNRVGAEKLRAIQARQSGRPFAYAGNAGVDLKVYAGADACWVVNPAPGLCAKLEAQGRTYTLVDDRRPLPVRLGAVFGAPWILVSLLTLAAALAAGKGLVAALAASGAYAALIAAGSVVRGFRDLDHNRRHPLRARRGVAGAEIHPGLVLAAAPALLVIALMLLTQTGAWTAIVAFGLGIATLRGGSHRRYSWWLTALLRPGLAALGGILIA